MPVDAFIDDDLKMAEYIKKRHLQCLAQIYDKYCAALFGVICRVTGNEHLAGEILSSVFIKAWNQTGDFFTCGTSLFTWLLKIARESAIDAMRGEEEVNPAGSNNVHPANKVSTAENAAFSKSSQMEGFALVYYRGMSPGEAAAALGKSVADLRVDLRNTIKNLPDKKVA
ncbi:N/A [soil metagenome]